MSDSLDPVYYNEIDPFCCQWLRNLIAEDLIPYGDVDERSIVEVTADDVKGYRQCHFFAGIGGWALALRMAGWSSRVGVWTGSCPCQPFSVAGKRRGEADERHLWPEWLRLIPRADYKYAPAAIFGEQVASKDGRVWLSGVRADLEKLGYEFGAADLCAAGVGAPHIRQRLYWVADRMAYGATDGRIEISANGRGSESGDRAQGRSTGSRLRGTLGRIADNLRPRLEGRTCQQGDVGEECATAERDRDGGMRMAESDERERGRIADRQWGILDGQTAGREQGDRFSEPGSVDGGMALSDGRNSGDGDLQRSGQYGQQPEDGGIGRLDDATDPRRTGSRECGSPDAAWDGARLPESSGRGTSGGVGVPECDPRDARRAASESREGTPGESGWASTEPGRSGNLGFWSDFSLIPCLDGKARRTQSGLQPLADGSSFKLDSGSSLAGKNRTKMLRAFGNAIVPQVAAEFIASYLEARDVSS